MLLRRASMLRTECAGCGHTGLSMFADLGSTPLADVFAADEYAAQHLPRYPLRAATCDKCRLAQLLDVVDDAALFGDDYGFETSGSPSAVEYMVKIADACRDRAPGQAVEIGSNDGTLLALLADRGFDAVGIDPSAASLIAADFGLNVKREPFTARLADSMAQQAKLVVALNVAAHVRDPHDFLEGVRLLLADDGVALVEFQNFPDLLAGCMFDLIYHEHRFFYTAGTFTALAAEHGLVTTGIVRSPQQGGSLMVRLRRYGMAWPIVDPESNAGLLAGFQQRAEYARDRIVETVRGYMPFTGRRLYGFAASAKSCTLLNWCGLGVDELPCIVDVTPGKMGRYAPGTGIPIISPDQIGGDPDLDPMPVPDAYLLLASNYLGGILRREQSKGYEGEFIVPLPLPVIV